VEAGLTPEALKVMKELRPDHVTLVPERAEEVTTEGGLDLAAQYGEVEVYVQLYREAEIPVSLFVNPEPDAVKRAAKLGPRFVELNTAAYAQAAAPADRAAALRRLADAAKQAAKLKLEVHAGHDLNYWNTGPFAAAVPEVAEVSIGHALVARAALVGLDRAVRDMVALLQPVR
jgi:pyridoxine 5-phosphate synthase